MPEIDVSLKTRSLQHPGRISGLWYNLSRNSKTTSGALTLGRLYLLPFLVTEALTIDQLGFRINTLAAAGNIKGGIWASDPTTFKPTGSPLTSFGDQTTAAAGAFAVDVTNVTLQPGLYYMGLISDNSTVAMTTLSTLDGEIGWLNGMDTIANSQFGATGTGGGGFYVTQSYATTLGDITAATFVYNASTANGAAFSFKAA